MRFVAFFKQYKAILCSQKQSSAGTEHPSTQQEKTIPSLLLYLCIQAYHACAQVYIEHVDSFCNPFSLAP
jgi:hypothetical protein